MIENILAIPSKDRLNDESIDQLAQAGIDIQIPGRELSTEISLSKNGRFAGRFTAALMRPKDIVRYVAAGKIALGIAGLDTVEEYRARENNPGRPINILLGLGIGRSRLALAIPNDRMARTQQEWWNQIKFGNVAGERRTRSWEDPARLVSIATSFPGLTRRFIKSNTPQLDLEDGVTVDICELDGAVEVAPSIGLSNSGIVDTVERGTTLEANGLREITTILESEALLITNLERRGNRMVDAVYGRLFNLFMRRTSDPFETIRKVEGFRILV